MSRGKSGPTSARARCGTTSPTQPMMPEVATLAAVTSVAAATIAMRNGPVASPSARASSSGNDITLSRQRSAISTMVPTATAAATTRGPRTNSTILDRRRDRARPPGEPRDEDLDELGERDGIASDGERDEEAEREQAQRDDEAWKEAAGHEVSAESLRSGRVPRQSRPASTRSICASLGVTW